MPKTFVRQFHTALRAADARHLAIAQNHHAELLTLDAGMHRAAKMLGIPIPKAFRLAIA